VSAIMSGMADESAGDRPARKRIRTLRIDDLMKRLVTLVAPVEAIGRTHRLHGRRRGDGDVAAVGHRTRSPQRIQRLTQSR
jgi:hypothetical protein